MTIIDLSALELVAAAAGVGLFLWYLLRQGQKPKRPGDKNLTELNDDLGDSYPFVLPFKPKDKDRADDDI